MIGSLKIKKGWGNKMTELKEQKKEEKKSKKINHMNLAEVIELIKKMDSEKQGTSKKYEQLKERLVELRV